MDAAGIDEKLVRDLLREQHPDLADLSIREVTGGWDNQMWRLGDELAVRIPRTPRGPYLLRTEQQWLPALAAGLPLPVPVPVRVGEPSARFPKTWTVVRWVAGEPADLSPITSPAAAGRLAGFLRALHRKAPAGAPVSPNRGVDLGTLAQDPGEWFTAIAGSGLTDSARRVWDRAAQAPAWPGAPVWLHGDLHPANVTVSAGTLCGVLDFGDMCAGDPATDLAAAWLLLPGGSAAPFFDAYAGVDSATVQRARGWAIYRALGLISIGRSGEQGLPGGKPTWLPAGWAALRRVLAPA